MKSYWIGAIVGALAGLGSAASVQAAPTGVPQSPTAVADRAPVVIQTGGRHWRHRHRHHRHYRHYGPRYGGYRYYGVPYYGWVAPRRYYRPYYGYYGHRHHRPGFSIWF
ncbi:MAG: hypothetical protein AB7L90_14030 [Hyphomicrobiaceae bacterium]